MNHTVEQVFSHCSDASGHCDFNFIEPSVSSATPEYVDIRTAATGILAMANGPWLEIYRPPKA